MNHWIVHSNDLFKTSDSFSNETANAAWFSKKRKGSVMTLFQIIFFGRVKTDKEAGSFVTKCKLLNIKFVQLLYTRVVFLWLQSSCSCNIIKYSKILARCVSSKRRLFYCSCFKLTFYSIRNWFCQQIYHFYTQD